MDEVLTFGGWIKQRRRTLDLTQEELAQRVGCATSTLKKIEQEERRPSRDMAEQLARALQLAPAEQEWFVRAARGLLAAEDAFTFPPVAPAPKTGRTMLRGYELREQIGAGGFGVVHRAFQPLVGRDVAIKIILPRHANHPDFIRRFEHEAHLVARLEHPQIVPLYDYWRDPNGAYLVMRWMRGGNLHAALAGGPLALDASVRLLEQISTSLAFAHRHAVVHRDLKPANILLDEERNAYLADFGIATDLGTTEPLDQAQGEPMLSSPAYTSPEQIRDEPVSAQTGIYSLGVLFYEMLAGTHPFQATTPGDMILRHLRDPVPSLTQRRPDLPAALDVAIATATAKDPAARYPSALSLLADVQRILGTGSALPPVVGQRPDETAGGMRRGAVAHAMPLLDERSLLPLENPYKGLRAFQEADAADFAGRDALTQHLLARLAEPSRLARFLAVVGPSGSGKSSVVRAGLLPALRRGDLPGAEQWFVVELIPGPHPLEELEAGLLRVATNPPPSLLAQLGEDARGLARAVKRVLPPDETTELLLIIDQFEELFTLVPDEQVRAHFLASLHAAASDPRSRLRVIVTLRADFYDRPLLYPGMGELMRDRTAVVVPLSDVELREAIVRPAERAGLLLEPELVAAIVADVGEQPGALPLLQYALTELFERREGPQLTLAAYQASGGVQGALARRADERYTGLPMREQAAARQLFLRLVTLGEGVEDTRRRVRRSGLATVVGDASVIERVVGTYGQYRLLTFDHDPVTREPTVELAHEALIRSWERLRAWIDASREELRLQRRLRTATGEWLAASRDPSFLATGARLQQFAALAATGTLALNADEAAYVQASLAEYERQAALEQERQARELVLQRRARRRLQGLVAVLAVATMIASGLTLFAFSQARLSTSRELAAAALSTLSVDTERAILLALQAISTASTREATEALHEAVQASRVQLTLAGHSGDVWSVAFSRDGRRIASGSADRTATIWDAATGTVVRTFSGHRATVWSVAFSPDGTRLATAGEDGTARVWDVASGEELLTLAGHGASVSSAVYSPDGARLATAGADGTAKVWDAATGQLLTTFTGHADAVNGVDFSPDGTRLATAGEDGTAKVWDAATGEELLTLAGDTEWLESVAFSPDGARLATAGADGTAKVWDLTAPGEQVVTFAGHATGVIGVAFTSDGSYLATGSQDGTARMWDVAAGKELFTLVDHDSAVNKVAISPGCVGPPVAPFTWCGTRLVTGSRDQTVKVWDISPAGSRELLTVPGLRLTFSPDGALLHTASHSREGAYELQTWQVPPSPDARHARGSGQTPPAAVHTGRIATILADPRPFVPARYSLSRSKLS